MFYILTFWNRFN